MFIENVKNFTKACEIIKNNGPSKKHLTCQWYIDNDLKKDNRSRIYIITSNGVIKKIGGSECKGGIQSTISFYESANTGKPSISRFAVQWMILEEIKKGNKIEVYFTFIENIKVKVKGLFSEQTIETLPSFKSSEHICLMEYRSIEGSFPEWNNQEGKKKSWPKEIEEEYIKSRARSGCN
jgi:hypothetical protein